MQTNNQQAFLALLRAGLWESKIALSTYGEIDLKVVYRLAQEQAVVGIVAAGLEHVVDTRIPQEVALTFVGEALQLEQRNKAMNSFIRDLVAKMRDAGIYTILVKGQGIAQLYKKPLWRASGDIDLLLSESNYELAKSFLMTLATNVEGEDFEKKHLSMTIDSWIVELHGSLKCGLSRRIDKVVENAQREVFYGGNVRSWINGGTQVFLPGINSDIVFIFAHILQHFFIEGVGLRQVCDWCRLLWAYRDPLDIQLLEKRLRNAGILTEWKTFASLAVNSLGMPAEAIPFYSQSWRYDRKARLLLKRIFKTGNMGHNNNVSYRREKSPFVSNVITFCRRLSDFAKFSLIFPLDSPRFFVNYVFDKLR